MYALEEQPNYEPLPSTSIAALAEKRGIHPLKLCLEILTNGDGKNMIYYAFLNYGEGTLEPAKEMMEHPLTEQWNKIFLDEWEDMHKAGLLKGIPVQKPS